MVGKNPSVAQFRTDMKRLGEQAGRGLEEATLRMADELIENMLQIVPRDTGALAASLRKKNVTKSGVRISAVSVLVIAGGQKTTRRSPAGPYDYALGVEFGTVDEAPQPFFYHTYREYNSEASRIFEKTMDEVIATNNQIRAARSSNYNNSSSTFSSHKGGAAVFHKGKR